MIAISQLDSAELRHG